MNPIKLIATYSRVSTGNQEVQETIKTQLSVLKEYAEKNNCRIVKQYVDDGWPGDNLVRPGLDNMRSDAKNKMWEGVLIYDPDRIARRYSYQELVMDEIREVGVEVMFITISAPKNDEDRMMYGMRGLFSEYERTKITERFRLGKIRKAKEGILMLSEPLYGYTYIKKFEKIPGRYEVNESEAKIANMIFSWVAYNCMTLRQVVKKLYELGIKPRRSKSGVWNTSTLGTLIRNKAYIGQAHWGKSCSIVPEKPFKNEKYKKIKKTSRKIRPESEWYIIPVPAIIDVDLFEKANKQLGVNFELCKRNKVNDYLLGNKIYCTCGIRRAGEGPQKGKYLYYRCSSRVHDFPLPATCIEKGVNARIADKLVWERLLKLMTTSDLMEEQIKRWLNSRQSESKVLAGNIPTIEKEILSYKNQQDKFNNAYSVDLITIEQLKEYLVPLKEKIENCHQRIVKLKEQENKVIDTALPTSDDIATFVEEAKLALHKLSFEQKREIVLNTIEKVVCNQQELIVTGYLAIPSPFYVNYKTITRHRQDSTRQSSKLLPFKFKIKLPKPNWIIPK